MASNKLDFSSERLITAIDIVDDMLFFTDNEKEPKKININDFKAANHSSGTTHIYNREFLERDITVIRPHPPTAIKAILTVSEEVNIEAEDPQIFTDPYASTTSSTAILKGKSINGGAFFKSRGFYYLELDSDTLPHEDTIISQGTRIEVGNDGDDFQYTAPNLTSGAKYFFLAFGQTSVNDEVLGSIHSFRVSIAGGFSTSPNITTNQVVMEESLILTLNGTISDDGGANVSETGFYYKIVSSLDTSTPPTTLHVNGVAMANSIKVSGDKIPNSPQKFHFDLELNGGGKKVYVQAWGKNENGEDQGSVVSFEVNQAAKPTLITNYDSGTSRYKAYAILCAKVDKPFGAIQSRGFYFSTKTKEFSQLINEANSGVFKHTDTSLTASNPEHPFTYATALTAGFTATTGETIHYVPWATNNFGATGYGSIGTAEYLEESSDPGIKTLTPEIQASGSQVSLVCRGTLASKENGPATEGATKVSFYITKTNPGQSLGVNQAAKRKEIIKRHNANVATEKVSTGFLGIYGLGAFNTTFTGDQRISSIEGGYDYHVCAVATTPNGIFLGDVLTAPYNVFVAGVTVETRGTNTQSATSATLKGAITKKLANASAIQAAGFVWATSLSALSNLRAMGASNHEYISSGDLTTLNTFISSGTGTGNFSFSKTGLTAGQKYYYQAFYTQSNTITYAKRNNAGSVYGGEDIYEFQLLPTVVVNPGILRLLIHEVVKEAYNITINANLDSGGNLFSMSPTYYYKKTNTVVGATEALRRSDIRATGTSGSMNTNVPLASSATVSIVAQKITGLEANTQYSIIAVANNGHTQSVTSGFSAGEFVSNVNTSTTGPAPSKPLPGDVEVSAITENGAKFRSVAKTLGGGDALSLSPNSIFYIKASDFSGSTPQQLSEDVDAIQPAGFAIHTVVDNLEPGTDYKAVAVLGNSYGNGYSRTITSFKTLGGAGNSRGENTISVQNNFIGISSEGIVHGDGNIEVEVTPSSASFNVKVEPWLNNRYSEQVFTRKTGTTPSGNRILDISIPRNPGDPRRCHIILTHSLDPSKTATIYINQESNPYSSPDPYSGMMNPFSYSSGGRNPYSNFF